jgi:hypothetical protein
MCSVPTIAAEWFFSEQGSLPTLLLLLLPRLLLLAQGQGATHQMSTSLQQSRNSRGTRESLTL